LGNSTGGRQKEGSLARSNPWPWWEVPKSIPKHVSNVKNISLLFQMQPVVMQLITVEKIHYSQASWVVLPMMFVTASIALGPTRW
jgi:hypothetical protein